MLRLKDIWNSTPQDVIDALLTSGITPKRSFEDYLTLSMASRDFLPIHEREIVDLPYFEEEMRKLKL
jgi:hypothetical protein